MQWNTIEKGQAYACLHSDGLWHRAIVEYHCYPYVHVYFCDIGDIENINDVRKLKYLPDEYRVLPKLAMTAKLYGIRPMYREWGMDDSKDFEEMTAGKKFQGVVMGIIDNENPDNNSVLVIRLIDVSNEIDVCINDVFVENGRAIRD